MIEQKYKMIILGPPASGKGTQAEFLAKKLNLPTISAGQLLREEVDKDSEIGREIKDYMEKGELVPNRFTNELVKARLEKDDCSDGFISDGFPRIRIQAKFLDTFVDLTQAIVIRVSDEEVERRLAGRRICSKCGKVYHLEFNPPLKENACECGGKLELREDDTPQAIHQRLKIYHEETEEVADYYQEKGILIEINGEQSIEKVKKEVFNKLKIKS